MTFDHLYSTPELRRLAEVGRLRSTLRLAGKDFDVLSFSVNLQTGRDPMHTANAHALRALREVREQIDKQIQELEGDTVTMSINEEAAAPEFSRGPSSSFGLSVSQVLGWLESIRQAPTSTDLSKALARAAVDWLSADPTFDVEDYRSNPFPMSETNLVELQDSIHEHGAIPVLLRHAGFVRWLVAQALVGTHAGDACDALDKLDQVRQSIPGARAK